MAASLKCLLMRLSRGSHLAASLKCLFSRRLERRQPSQSFVWYWMSSFTLEGADAFDGPPWKREESRSHETWMNTLKNLKYFASGRISYVSEKKNPKSCLRTESKKWRGTISSHNLYVVPTARECLASAHRSSVVTFNWR